LWSRIVLARQDVWNNIAMDEQSNNLLRSVALPALDLMTHDVRACHRDSGTAATRIRLG
jgi:hypothetical protein